MLFTSFIFYLFLVAVFGAYLLLPGRRSRAVLLLAASYAFYCYWNWRFAWLLVVVTGVDFAVGRALARIGTRPARVRLVLASCLTDLGLLGVFKYFNFFADTSSAAASSLGMRLDFAHLHLILPLGISFYTLKSLSYVIDVYRRRIPAARSFLDYGLFVSFFPNLMAGPIDRAGSLLPQFARLSRPARRQAAEGLVLISLGLFKKVLIGDAAGRIVDEVFGQPHLYKSPELLAALVLFSIQIYADFAGYSDIARGVARLFGVELMRNFEQPYLSRSFSEFWRRWHISLSAWIWDYLFNPILSGLLRRIARWNLTVRQEMNIAYPIAVVATMLLCGLWHGAGITFIVWGGLHGLFLAGERLFVYRGRAISKRAHPHGAGGFARLAMTLASTQLLVLFAWLFFRADSLAQAEYFLEQFVNWSGSELSVRFALIVASFGGVMLLLDLIAYFTESDLFLLRLKPAAAAGVCVGAVLVVALYLATSRSLPFVYFRF
jgi:alginate O-acetyltransferase complex protein AlgI